MQRRPNIYAAATSSFGLPVVVPDTDGDGVPERTRRGSPNATFTPGLFGPVSDGGGPESIWKIDGRTGAVTLFTNVLLDGAPNPGPALGGLAFDATSRQIYVADRATGTIHSFALNGLETGRFDHGAQALPAVGLPPLAFNPRQRPNIQSPAFDSGNPATWGYAPPARRVFGLAVQRGRLYYAVAAGPRVWSVSLAPNGAFGADARIEVVVPASTVPNSEISKILFDDDGDMLLAERGAPTGAYDYEALAQSGENRVLRFRPKRPEDPPSPGYWFPAPREYAIGFPPNYRNDNGGIAIGYGYDPVGNINRAVCGGTLWSTGEQLRNARDPAIVQRLQPGGPLIVNGLQGNSTRLLRPLNEPPFESYFIDYDDRFDDPPARGHLGDVVIWRLCGQAMLPVVPLALPVVCPAGLFNVDGVCGFPLACPAGTEFADGCCVYRGCPAGNVRIRGRCVPPPMRCNSDETYSDGRCEGPKCPAGQIVIERKSSRSVIPAGNGNCPEGQELTNDVCQPIPGGNKPKMCGSFCACPPGTRPQRDGTCKPPDSCGGVEHMVPARGGGGECTCEDGYQWITGESGSGTCIPTSQCDLSRDITAGCCPAGKVWDKRSLSCQPRFNSSCSAAGTALDGVFGNNDPNCPTPTVCAAPSRMVGATCCSPELFAAGMCGGTPPPTTTSTCPPGASVINGQCVFTFPVCRGSDCPPVTSLCANGQRRDSEGYCPTPTTTTGCPGGAQRIDGQCPGTTTAGGCKSGQFRGDDGKCQNRPSRCGANQSWNGETCVKNTKKKKEGNKERNKEKVKERQRSDSDRLKSSRTNQLKQVNPSPFQRGTGNLGGLPRRGR